MTPRDWFIVIFTFVVGLFSGMYFYVTSYAPLYGEDQMPQQGVAEQDLSIIGVTYGGTDTVNYIHPSFRVNSDRSYDYFPGGTAQQEKVEGTLPQNLFNAIKNAVARSDLVALTQPIRNGSCPPTADEIEYEYDIEIEGIEYELDTCRTVFDADTELATTLAEVWEYLDEPEEYRFSVSNSPGPDGVQSIDDGWCGLRCYFERGFKSAGFDSNF